MNINRLTRISLFTALMIVFTVIIPPIPVPIININVTLQTFIVMLAGLLLKPIDAFISILLYVLIGALGFPVFSGYKSGLGVILGPTGGFIIAFPFVSLLISILKFKNSFILNIIITMFCGIIVTYFIG
ncbi:MAG TPA: biotin transporter BioY, partial [Haloplasmataceae bacterium]